MKTVKLYEKNESVMIKGVVDEIAMENGEIVYSIKSVDTGKNMGIWFRDNQLIPYDNARELVKNTEPIIEGN